MAQRRTASCGRSWKAFDEVLHAGAGGLTRVSRHALDVLEFDRVLERVAARASSELGRRRLMSLLPSDDLPTVKRELGRVASTMRFIDEAPDWGMVQVPDVSSALALLRAEGTVLEPIQMHQIGVLLNSSRRLSVELKARDDRFPELDALAGLLIERRDLEQSIERCVDAEGHVLDSASSDLKKVRSRLRGAHSRIVKKLEGYLSTLSDRFVVSDGSVTIRDGRYVIPVRREGKGEVGGIIHDESQSGATIFVEPPIAIGLMNDLRDLEREEGREIRRVLGERTAAIAPEAEGLRGALGALIDFDTLHTRARVALKWRAVIPEMHDARDVHIHEGRHPLLLDADPKGVVPFEFDLLEDERAVVVSGPNTGGKSVFLKATGLVCALAQSGVVPPVGKGTRLPLFSTFFADIGDEQSIAQNLSTFSAHLANLSEIVAGADHRSLVLIDEMGTGTDPAEGAALARSILEELVARGATALVSSHLGDLKRLDSEGSGIVNASLQFDAERMAPTYRFVKGRPGRSYGLAIARRMGFPDTVLDRAEGYRNDDEAHMEEVLASLEKREAEAGRLVHELDLERVQSARLRAEIERREIVLRDAERGAELRARDDARKLLMDARAEVDEAIAAVRRAAEEQGDLEGAARSARRQIEEAARRQRDMSASRSARPAAAIEPGDRVRIHASGARGTVSEVRSNRALVEVGALRMEVALSELDVVDAAPVANISPFSGLKSGGWVGPELGQARIEVDLRGMRVDEMELELQRALDQAIIEDMSELRIIHGKGTGALRARVSEVLGADTRIQTFRMGGPTEGGAGVTVASFGVPA
ncbi:MAG: endonuclease MutS2 [Gemmatimonadetes bacterium]|nr:endonuclease MutS2 [Gemmatimonadota bacterium]